MRVDGDWEKDTGQALWNGFQAACGLVIWVKDGELGTLSRFLGACFPFILRF